MTPRTALAGRHLSLAIFSIVIIVSAACLGSLYLPDDAAGFTDYVEYGTAARLLRNGENPYSGERMLAVESEAGWTDPNRADSQHPKANMMWNPPWVFPLVLPNAYFSWNTGLAAWSAVQFVVVLFSCLLMWRACEGEEHFVLLIPVALILFTPLFFLVRLGQISGFLVLGVAGFAAAMKAGRPTLAGCALALTAVKPHLLFPFGVLLLCDALRSRDTRKAVLTGATILVACAAFPMMFKVDVWKDYLAAVNAPTDQFHTAPGEWNPPILSAKLRDLVGGGMPVQMLPSILATAALVGWWWRNRNEWDWTRQLPMVVTVSLLTTGYGAWGFDLVLMLIPVVAHAAAISRSTERIKLWSACAYMAINAVMFVNLFPVLWWTPMIGLWCIAFPGVHRKGDAFPEKKNR